MKTRRQEHFRTIRLAYCKSVLNGEGFDFSQYDLTPDEIEELQEIDEFEAFLFFVNDTNPDFRRSQDKRWEEFLREHGVTEDRLHELEAILAKKGNAQQE